MLVAVAVGASGTAVGWRVATTKVGLGGISTVRGVGIEVGVRGVRVGRWLRGFGVCCGVEGKVGVGERDVRR
jgi:hypothetical protein